MILFIGLISLYVLIPFLFLLSKPRRKLIKKIEKESSIEELKQNIKWIKIPIIAMPILLGISIILTRNYDIISFVNLHLMWFLFVYFFTFYRFLLKSIIKEKEQKEKKKEVKN